jgi:DNA-binding PadR family transcriptional regulator
MRDNPRLAAHLPLRPVAAAVLSALAQEACTGVEILERANRTFTVGRLLGPGTLYRLLRELRQADLIARLPREGEQQGPDDRYTHHALTRLGRAVLAADADRLRRTLALAEGRTGSAR